VALTRSRFSHKKGGFVFSSMHVGVERAKSRVVLALLELPCGEPALGLHLSLVSMLGNGGKQGSASAGARCPHRLPLPTSF